MTVKDIGERLSGSQDVILVTLYDDYGQLLKLTAAGGETRIRIVKAADSSVVLVDDALVSSVNDAGEADYEPTDLEVSVTVDTDVLVYLAYTYPSGKVLKRGPLRHVIRAVP